MRTRSDQPSRGARAGERVDRRRFLRLVGLAGAAGSILALGAACAPTPAAAPAKPAEGAKPAEPAKPAEAARPAEAAKPGEAAQKAPAAVSNGQVVIMQGVDSNTLDPQ